MTYDPRNGTSVLTRCFGGAPAAVAALVDRPWDCIEAAARAPLRLQLRWPRPLDAGRLDRAFGCLLGYGVGADHAAGAVSPGGGHQKMSCAPVRFQSDTMALAVAFARSLVRRGGYDPADMAGTYRRWQQSRADERDGDSAASGGGTRAAQVSPAPDDAPIKRSLARIAPLGILCAGQPSDAARLARDDAQATGAPALCSEAACVYAGLVAALVDGRGPLDVPALLDVSAGLVTMASSEGRNVLAVLRAAAARSASPDKRPSVSAGTRVSEAAAGPSASAVLNGLCAAIHALGGAEAADSHRLRAAFESLTLAQGARDSTGDSEAAAAAGALIGARYGVQNMREWSLAVQASRGVSSTGEGPRPDEYWPDDLPVLADALLSAGSDRRQQ